MINPTISFTLKKKSDILKMKIEHYSYPAVFIPTEKEFFMHQKVDVDITLSPTKSLIFSGTIILINHFETHLHKPGVGILCDEKNAIAIRTELNHFITTLKNKKDAQSWIF